MSTARPHSPWRAEFGATLRLAGPLALANLLQMAVYAVDVIFLARLGAEALAISSLSVALSGLLMWVMTGLVGGAAPLIAAELGRRRHSVREVRRTFRMGVWLAVGSGLFGMALLTQGEALMRLSGQTPELAAGAGRFLAVLMWMSIPMVLAGHLRNAVAALGRPGVSTGIAALAVAVNAAGNYVLIFGHFGFPALGLNGSAVASVITSLAMVGGYCVVIVADRRLCRYRLFGRWWRPEWSRLREMARIGAPIALTILAEAGLFSGAAFLMGRIGAAELAAHTLALQLAAFSFQIPFGVGQAATIRVGYHFGAGDRPAMSRAGWAAIAIAVAFATLAAAVMITFPRTILSLYIDPAAAANATLTLLAVQYLAIAAAFQLFDGTQAVAAGALRGLQDTRVPMAIAMFGYWLPGLCTSLVLGFWTPLGGVGVWIGLAVGLVVVAGLLVHRWARRERFVPLSA